VIHRQDAKSAKVFLSFGREDVPMLLPLDAGLRIFFTATAVASAIAEKRGYGV
jgi:hypothetical protein